MKIVSDIKRYSHTTFEYDPISMLYPIITAFSLDDFGVRFHDKTGVKCGSKTASPSGAPDFTPVF
jgi:hypothetical protein